MTADVVLAEKTIDEEIHDALEGDWGKIFFNLRYRFEHVEQDDLQTANGDPVRLRLGYLTPQFAAEGALNQAWLSLAAIPDTVIKGGRQKIDWDNERFICPAAWRQMEQTFDSVTLLNTSVADFSVNAAYLWNAITTSNEDVNMQSPLVNLKYSFQNIGSLSGYGYWLDYDDPDDSGPFEYAYSSQTYGLHFNGSPAVSDNLKLLYTAEYAIRRPVGLRGQPQGFYR
ncbi:MAG: alginate export family protein [Deltaproteobacteria bacterium]|nr:alginate export family protein [Deltaproteobacteria bacterium]